MARLLYIALWCEADREGRMAWKPKTFKMRYLPADDCDIDALCNEIVARGLVVLYADGYAWVPSFEKHQHINPRESKSTLPDPHASVTRRPRVKHATVTVETRDSDAQVGKERKGSISSRVPSDDDTPTGGEILVCLPLNDGSEHEVTSEDVGEWSASFPAVDVPQQLRSMRAWLNAHPSRRKTRRGVDAFVVSWLSRQQDKGRVNGSANDDDPYGLRQAL